MKIEATQEDIDKGLAENCVSCPIALAVSRATGTIFFVNKDQNE